MRFRLTYEGELRPTQRDPLPDEREPLATHKHNVRRHFHSQLRHLWRTDRFLRDTRVHPKLMAHMRAPNASSGMWAIPEGEKMSLQDYVAGLYRENNYRFVPLVLDDFSLLCSLKILFMRRDIPGSVIQAGDIDNRIKTLIDALRRPRGANELLGHENPQSDEEPFFVLLEDDKQVSHLEVETDQLLDEPTSGSADQRRVRLVITVELRPYSINMFNLSFAG